MKIKDGFVLREVAGQTVVIGVGALSEQFHGMIRLNDTGAEIWKGLSRGDAPETIAEHLTKTYDVDADRALADVQAFVSDARSHGFLDEA